MFRRRRNIHARRNEWIHVHRNRTNGNSSNTSSPSTWEIVGIAVVSFIGVGILVQLVTWLFGLFLAALPYLLLLALGLIVFAILRNKT